VLDRTHDVAANGLSLQGTKEAESLLRFIESRDILLTASRVLAPTPVFLQVEGPESAGIRIDGGDRSKATQSLAFKAEASEKSVTVSGS
jgi:hypothetical protein